MKGCTPCFDCGDDAFPTWWRASDELWTAVVGRTDIVLCPADFAHRALVAGRPVHFEAVEGHLIAVYSTADIADALEEALEETLRADEGVNRYGLVWGSFWDRLTEGGPIPAPSAEMDWAGNTTPWQAESGASDEV